MNVPWLSMKYQKKSDKIKKVLRLHYSRFRWTQIFVILWKWSRRVIKSGKPNNQRRSLRLKRTMHSQKWWTLIKQSWIKQYASHRSVVLFLIRISCWKVQTLYWITMNSSMVCKFLKLVKTKTSWFLARSTTKYSIKKSTMLLI